MPDVSSKKTLPQFGLRAKVALLVMVAAASSAYLVATLLAKRAEAVLRQHELVDLGDEAELRGWEIADQVDGLREDTRALAYSGAFLRSYARGDKDEDLAGLARDICRRYWGRYLKLDIITFPEGEKPFPLIRSLHEPEQLDFGDEIGWLPMPTRTRPDAGPGIILSSIQRHSIIAEDGTVRAVPVVWACAQLPEFPPPAPDAPPKPPKLIRILLSLESAPSPRHFFALIDSDKRMLVRPDESLPLDKSNDEIFLSLASDPEITEQVSQSFSPKDREAPQVQPLILRKNIELDQHYRFQEGRPSKALQQEFAELDEEVANAVLEELSDSNLRVGRVGGMAGGTAELRLLVAEDYSIREVRDGVNATLAETFSDHQVNWRELVNCDDIDVWVISLGLGSVDYMRRYLMFYAVLDDELASSIQYDMSQMRQFALALAAFAGIVAFIMAVYFVQPLQKMTAMSHRVTESEPERLPENLRELIDELPVRRRDEVGDIARASQRLYQEVLSNQEQLELRVQERTAELEEANAQLQSLSHEKDAFVAKVSHDLRQPLNAIFLQVEALKLSTLDEGQQHDVKKIQDHASRELQLVNDILEYQKIIMGAETLCADEIDPRKLIEEVALDFTSTAEKKSLTLTTSIQDGLPHFTADRRRLCQILENLVSNAIKFTSEGAVEINGAVDGERISFSVKDTGRGMSPGEASKAFDPFVSNKKGNEGGTGLGLAICRELTGQMDGQIELETTLGQGACFTVRLPLNPTLEHQT